MSELYFKELCDSSLCFINPWEYREINIQEIEPTLYNGVS